MRVPKARKPALRRKWRHGAVRGDRRRGRPSPRGRLRPSRRRDRPVADTVVVHPDPDLATV